MLILGILIGVFATVMYFRPDTMRKIVGFVQKESKEVKK